MDIEIAAKGDLHIDQHHTVEDVGIALGQAFARRLAICAASSATPTLICRWTKP